VRGRLPQFEPGVLTGEVQPRIGLTPYVRFGNTAVLVIILRGLVGAVASWRRVEKRA
jgi:apolipoprotein N-acyltransferase